MNKKVSQFDQLDFQQQIIREEYILSEQQPPERQTRELVGTHLIESDQMDTNLTD